VNSATPGTPNPVLSVSFVEVGVPGSSTAQYSITATISATWVCINGGGNHPQATNKTVFQGPLSGTGTGTADRSGKVTATFLVPGNIPTPPADFCPTGQTAALAEVDFTNIVLTDITNNASVSGPDASVVYIKT
jgi:hypothetical protein